MEALIPRFRAPIAPTAAQSPPLSGPLPQGQALRPGFFRALWGATTAAHRRYARSMVSDTPFMHAPYSTAGFSPCVRIFFALLPAAVARRRMRPVLLWLLQRGLFAWGACRSISTLICRRRSPRQGFLQCQLRLLRLLRALSSPRKRSRATTQPPPPSSSTLLISLSSQGTAQGTRVSGRARQTC